jgi:hypothetical protein
LEAVHPALVALSELHRDEAGNQLAEQSILELRKAQLPVAAASWYGLQTAVSAVLPGA